MSQQIELGYAGSAEQVTRHIEIIQFRCLKISTRTPRPLSTLISGRIFIKPTTSHQPIDTQLTIRVNDHCHPGENDHDENRPSWEQKVWLCPRFERGTTCTRSRYHTSRPTEHWRVGTVSETADLLYYILLFCRANSQYHDAS